jgi:O-antigen/teichoic acid export membrane protein
VSLKRNVVANYVGQGWRALMQLAFVPLYIRYLGIEAYGLIGIFAILQAWLALLDLGMKPALGREMARFTAGARSAESIRDLLRSVEVLGLAVAALVAFGIWAASGWLASDWLRAGNLPTPSVAQAVAIMGAVAALRFIETIYDSTLVGLQRQVLENVVSSVMATIRGVGAVLVLVLLSPTIEAFFIWQGVMSAVSVAVLAVAVYRTLPPAPRRARFSVPELLLSWRFAAGMMVITVLALLLTQVDKILLSRLLTLEAFGYYALAATVANALYMLSGPVSTAAYPRFTELVTRGDESRLRAVYHESAQAVTVLMGAAAIVLIVLGERVLLVWTGDPRLTAQVTPVMKVLALGTLLHGLMWIPYYLQLAYGWTSLTIRINIVAVALLIPAILWVVPAYGAIGAAWVWVALNAGYLTFVIYFMHRRLLRSEKARWYVSDVAVPLIAATAAAWLARWALPSGLGKFGEISVLAASAAFVLTAAALTAPLVRARIARYLPRSSTPVPPLPVRERGSGGEAR